MELFITILIYIHAFFGGVGLLSGLGSIIVKKGSLFHRRLGLIFSYSMGISSLLSLFVARMPGHTNLFLFLIGVFTIYLVLAGNRALTFKHPSKTQANWIDKSVSGVMFLVSIIMLGLGILGMIQDVEHAMLYLFFGGFGTFMTLRDFQTFKTFKTNKTAWLKSHLGRMVGALIASVTAFMVAGLHIGTLMVWISPTVLGTVYVIYWNRTLKPASPKPAR